MPVLTIGHSTRGADEFIGMLRAHGVELLADVRTVPRSRFNPQFNLDTLPNTLESAGIGFVHMPGLGGLRKARPDSINDAWRNDSFRGYADYMQTEEFAKNLQRLIELAEGKTVAIMCAESVPWRCHRSLIADAVVARGLPVEHIMSPIKRDRHKLRDFARVTGDRVTYPAETLFQPGE